MIIGNIRDGGNPHYWNLGCYVKYGNWLGSRCRKSRCGSVSGKERVIECVAPNQFTSMYQPQP